MGDESLYFSGTELAWPARELATPAPRGHVPGVAGMNGGRRLMECCRPGAESWACSCAQASPRGAWWWRAMARIAGMLVTCRGDDLQSRQARYRLACGGFIHNREMLQRYAPELYDCSVPWGNAGDQGDGINMGIAVGAEALRMHQGFAIAPIYPPENVLSGILVNSCRPAIYFRGVLSRCIGRCHCLPPAGSRLVDYRSAQRVSRSSG